jgi:chromosome partitioning protein
MDCPPALGFVTINALQTADTVIVPVQCHFLALDGLTQLLNTIRIVQKSKKVNNRELSLEGVLITMLDKRIKMSWEVIKEIKDYFGEKVFKTFITMNVSCQVAPAHGMPVSKYDKKGVAAKLYKELAKEVIKNNG